MRFAVLIAAIAFTAAAANAASVPDAKKTCLARYDVEKSGGTIPVGMSKTTYINQCIGSIRRNAQQQQELEAPPAVAEPVAGANEVTVGPRPVKPVATMNKPVRVKTPVAVGSGQ